MNEFGEKIGEVPVGTLHASVTTEDGETIEVGDIVQYEEKDLNLNSSPDHDPWVMSEVCTGVVSDIYKHGGNTAELSIERDNYGRISVDDVSKDGDRIDRYFSEASEPYEGCIIERWNAWLGVGDCPSGFEEYEIEVNTQ